MKKAWWIIGIVAVLLIGVYGFVSISNNMITFEENVNVAWSEVENQQQRRYDLIPNLVETVKGYASHEEEIFTSIAEARSQLAGARTVSDKVEASNELEGALSRLLLVVENYPNLKADQSFRDLSYELSGTENRIAVARQRYNDAVRTFNVKIRTFPNSIVASMKGLEPMTMFEAVAGAGPGASGQLRLT